MRIIDRDTFQVQKFLTSTPKSLGLTPIQFKVLQLWFIDSPGYPVYQCEMALSLNVTRQSVNRSFRRMVELGYLTAKYIPIENGKRVEYQLTALFGDKFDEWALDLHERRTSSQRDKIKRINKPTPNISVPILVPVPMEIFHDNVDELTGVNQDELRVLCNDSTQLKALSLEVTVNDYEGKEIMLISRKYIRLAAK